MTTISIWTALQTNQIDSVCATSLALFLEHHLPHSSIEVIDVVEEWGQTVRKTLLREGMSALQSWLPHFWSALYDKQSHDPNKDLMASLRHIFPIEQIRADVETRTFDLVIVCHPAAAWLASQVRWPSLETDPSRSFPVLSWIPSFHVHPSHAQPGISRVGLPHSELANDWIELGISPDKLWHGSIPFPIEPVSPEKAGQQLNVPNISEPIILLRADMFSMSELALWFQQCPLLSNSYQWWLDFGDDLELAAHLREEAQRWNVPARMFGQQSSQRHLFYTVADVVFMKAHAWSVMEVLACDTPVALWDPVSGSETKDAIFLVTQKLGVVVDDLLRLDTILDQAISQTPSSPMLLKDAPKYWTAEIQYLLDHRDSIALRDAQLLLHELEHFSPVFDDELDPITPPTEALTPTSPPPIFEDIGQDPAFSKTTTHDQKDGMLSSREEAKQQLEHKLQNISLDQQLAQLKQRMTLDKSNLDLSKLKDE